MNLIDRIRCYADPDAFVIFWDRPEGSRPAAAYELGLNGVPKAATAKTHYAFTGLTSGTEYKVTVWAVDDAGSVFDEAEIVIATPAWPERIDVTKEPYLAVGDGVTKNTAALQRAIDDCPAGGSVVLPAGTFLTGALCLHSDMELLLKEGAVLLGSADPADYLPSVSGRADGLERQCFRSLLNIGVQRCEEGPNCRHVIIRGKGTITGGGARLESAMKKEERSAGGLITIANTDDVRIDGLTLTDGPGPAIHLIYSQNLITHDCTFRSGTVPDGGGFIADSSENAVVAACTFFTEGACVAVESGKDEEGKRIARPSRQIRVSDCKAESGHGITIGSEISGGVENVKIWDCDLERTVWGIQVRAGKTGGGYVRGLWVEDCTVPCLRVLPAGGYDRKSDTDIPSLGNFFYERVKVTGSRFQNGEWRDCRSVEMEGFDKEHPLCNVLLTDLVIPGGLGIHTEFCENLRFEGGTR